MKGLNFFNFTLNYTNILDVPTNNLKYCNSADIYIFQVYWIFCFLAATWMLCLPSTMQQKIILTDTASFLETRGKNGWGMGCRWELIFPFWTHLYFQISEIFSYDKKCVFLFCSSSNSSQPFDILFWRAVEMSPILLEYPRSLRCWTKYHEWKCLDGQSRFT